MIRDALRPMRRLLAASALLFTTSPAWADPSTGSAQLHPIDRSGISAEVEFLDSGAPTNTLVVRGRATGLDPSKSYVSLVYDTGAVPGGPNACLPSPSSPLSAEQMFLGPWTVSSDGIGDLFVTKVGSSYAALESVGAVSVRLASDRSLQACGRVHVKP